MEDGEREEGRRKGEKEKGEERGGRESVGEENKEVKEGENGREAGRKATSPSQVLPCKALESYLFL